MRKMILMILMILMMIGCDSTTRVVEVDNGEEIALADGESVQMPQPNVTAITATEEGVVINTGAESLTTVTITSVVTNTTTTEEQTLAEEKKSEDQEEDIAVDEEQEESANPLCFVSAGTQEKMIEDCEDNATTEECDALICKELYDE